jgi:hypothetical protein
MMDVLRVQDRARVVHSVAADVFHENFDEVALSHHRTQNEE